jgi:AraC-like DNA-binding protein
LYFVRIFGELTNPRHHRRRASKLQHWAILARSAHYRTSRLAVLCHVSVRQLERDFDEEMGRTPQDWLNEQRAVAARHLLLEGTELKQILKRLGFKQRSQFSRDFKKYHGISPSMFVSVNLTFKGVGAGNAIAFERQSKTQGEDAFS